MTAPIPPNEAERLAALKAYHVLDTEPERVYDDIVSLAALLCRVPVAIISLVDKSRQWFKSRLGVGTRETSREVAFCAQALLQSEPLIVTDALKDPRFAGNNLVKRAPRIRFYAGFPLTTSQGLTLGALCVVDHKPRRLSAQQQQAMQALAHQVMVLLEARRISTNLAHALERIRTLHGLLPICAWCKRIRDDDGYWKQVESYVHAHTEAEFTHGICPDCFQKVNEKKQKAA